MLETIFRGRILQLITREQNYCATNWQWIQNHLAYIGDKCANTISKTT
jgi:hypothetical protein